ncbi:MAG: proline--tRNA ligase [Zetaproteobacteria bacterium]|nr:proline--tRNA ligase [Zetaproteobacteria bacterium]
MSQNKNHGITPPRSENFPNWYQEVVKAGEFAENSPVRGCMVIHPWGYGIWESIQRLLDQRFKETGHENAYFPLFIPKSFLEKEAEHVDGFAKECAVVTHHRLEQSQDGSLIPAGELDEPLVVRPTSETIIGASFSKWVQSYRDLPILINQWANVVRWEMRTRLFLRSSEFLWQEGHTAHATREEAEQETAQMLHIYSDFAINCLALPVIQGSKTVGERFPGAEATYTIEAVMQDGKALQCGTSHFLGQNFSKAQDIQFSNAEGQQEHAWTTSWGVSTRMIGAVLMTHGDDDGARIPPRIAPYHIVVMPIYRSGANREEIDRFCEDLARKVRSTYYAGEAIRIKVDRKEKSGGGKAWEYIRKGVPIRVEVGPRDVEAGSVFFARRDKTPKEKASQQVETFVDNLPGMLAEIQENYLTQAQSYRDKLATTVDTQQDFVEAFQAPITGFVGCFAADNSDYTDVLDSLKVTPRCIPTEEAKRVGKCIFTGQDNAPWTLFARAY